MSLWTTQDTWSVEKKKPTANMSCKKKSSTQLLIWFLIEFFKPSLNIEVKLSLNVMPFSEITSSLLQAYKKTP